MLGPILSATVAVADLKAAAAAYGHLLGYEVLEHHGRAGLGLVFALNASGG